MWLLIVSTSTRFPLNLNRWVRELTSSDKSFFSAGLPLVSWESNWLFFSIYVALRKWRQFCITRWAQFQILSANASKSAEARAQKTFNLLKSACDPWERQGQPLGLGWRRCWSSKKWTLILWEKRERILIFMWNKCNLCVYVGLISSPVSQTRSVTTTWQQSRTLLCRWNLS